MSYRHPRCSNTDWINIPNPASWSYGYFIGFYQGMNTEKYFVGYGNENYIDYYPHNIFIAGENNVSIS